ncbi:hypothetical protein LSAT2_021630 [Lamellibrachia satsuma]|nr:hypothetical protein LSAT2_021630 [Lamellibrachia satsuma]
MLVFDDNPSIRKVWWKYWGGKEGKAGRAGGGGGGGEGGGREGGGGGGRGGGGRGPPGRGVLRATRQRAMIKPLVLVVVLVASFDVYATPGWLKCGGGSIPAWLYRCCDGVPRRISKLPADGGCCGKATYRMSSELCCNGAVHVMNSGKFCCGNQVYAINEQRCLSVILRLLSLLKSSANRQQPAMYKSFVLVLMLMLCLYPRVQGFPGWIKCGGGKIPGSLYRCCGGIAYSSSSMAGRSCCGKHTYVREIELCCKDVIYRKTDEMFCCGNTIVRVDAFMRDVLSSDIDERALTEVEVKEPKEMRQAADSVMKHYLSDLDGLIQFDGLVAETLMA